MRVLMASLIALTLVGCGSDGASGERRIGGDVTFSIGSNFNVLAYGVAVPPGELSQAAFTVLMSTSAIDCSTDPLGRVPGNYVTFDPTSASPMVYDSLFIGVVHTGGGFHYNGASGHVEITSISETSVAGSIDHTDDDQDGQIRVLGTFEVVRCF